MINDEQHVALPKLYGAPAYARPPRPVVEASPRPIDEDDLPLEAFRVAEDELALAASAPAGDDATGNGNGEDAGPRLSGRPFSLRSLSRFVPGR